MFEIVSVVVIFWVVDIFEDVRVVKVVPVVVVVVVAAGFDELEKPIKVVARSRTTIAEIPARALEDNIRPLEEKRFLLGDPFTVIYSRFTKIGRRCMKSRSYFEQLPTKQIMDSL